MKINKPKPPHSIYKIKVDIYNFNFFVVICEDYNETLEYFGDINTDKKLSLAFVRAIDECQNLSLFIKKDTENSVIAHEVVHIVSEIFRWRGIKYDIDNDEPQAYLTGYLFKEIEKVIQKHSKNK